MHKNAGNHMKTFCRVRLEVALSTVIALRPVIHLFHSFSKCLASSWEFPDERDSVFPQGFLLRPIQITTRQSKTGTSGDGWVVRQE